MYNYTEYNSGPCRLSNRHSRDERSIHGLALQITAAYHQCCLLTQYAAYNVCHGRHKSLIGHHVTETTTGQTRQLLIVLSATDVIDTVGVAHRYCRQHEWMGFYQWRLSFSRVEIVLTNSWMPVQQIVYIIMLRFFMKTNRLIDSANISERVVSNNRITTVMLWTSELKPSSWWTENLNLVRICVKLLHILSICTLYTLRTKYRHTVSTTTCWIFYRHYADSLMINHVTSSNIALCWF